MSSDYDKCKCGMNPATHDNEFSTSGWQYGMLDKILAQEFEATCKTCGEKFNFSQGKMSSECDKCGEHAVECKCPRNWVSKEMLSYNSIYPIGISEVIEIYEDTTEDLTNTT